jgi:hypothetical protein
VLPGAGFFFSTEVVANLGDASLGMADSAYQRKATTRGRVLRARGPRVFSFFGPVRRYETAVTGRDPSTNGSIGTAATVNKRL